MSSAVYGGVVCSLTLGSVDHLSVDGCGDDWLREVLQVPTQAIAQDWQFQLIQLC